MKTTARLPLSLVVLALLAVGGMFLYFQSQDDTGSNATTVIQDEDDADFPFEFVDGSDAGPPGGEPPGQAKKDDDVTIDL